MTIREGIKMMKVQKKMTTNEKIIWKGKLTEKFFLPNRTVQFSLKCTQSLKHRKCFEKEKGVHNINWSEVSFSLLTETEAISDSYMSSVSSPDVWWKFSLQYYIYYWENACGKKEFELGNYCNGE